MPPQAEVFNLKVEFSREEDGRWIADIPALPGVTVYGRTRKQALASAEALALRVIADRLEHGEEPHPCLSRTAANASSSSASVSSSLAP
jgi:predicted RNase H-like HicB family nuclease